MIHNDHNTPVSDMPSFLLTVMLTVFSVAFNGVKDFDYDTYVVECLHIFQLLAAFFACVIGVRSWYRGRSGASSGSGPVVPLILFLLAISSTSCTGPRAIEKACIKCGAVPQSSASTIVTHQNDSVQLVHDTLRLPPDESLTVGTVVCDSLGQVVYTLQQQLSGSALAVPEVIVKNNIVYTRCKVDSQAIGYDYYIRHQILFTSKSDSVVVTVPEYRDRPLTWWQQFKLDYGGYSMGSWLILLLVILGYILYKFKKFIPWI